MKKLLLSFGRSFMVPMVLFIALLVMDKLSTYQDPLAVNFFGLVGLALWVATKGGLLMIPMLLMGRASRWFYCPFCLLFIVALFVQWYVRLHFSMNIDGDWIGIVLSSSQEEVRMFFQEALSVSVVVSLLLAGLGVIVLLRWLWIREYRNGDVMSLLGAIVLAGSFLLQHNQCVLKPKAFIMEHSPSLYFLCDTYWQKDFYPLLQRLRDSPILPRIERIPVGSKAPVMVVVLGESATRNHWALYGYGRMTTPRMSAIKDELVVFTDLVGSASETASTMRLLFTEATQEYPLEMNCTLSQLLKAAGYRCVLVTNQVRWSKVDGVEQYVFSGCDETIFLSEEHIVKPWHDNALLPYLDRELYCLRDCPTIVFLHLYGSHYPCYHCYPHDFPCFQVGDGVGLVEDKGINEKVYHYDNSIFFTDWLLGEIVDRLKKVNRPTLMFYLSDHGESPDSGRWRDMEDMCVWELPMICWTSSIFQKTYPEMMIRLQRAKDRPLQTERLLNGMSSLFFVNGYGKPEDDFLDDRFVPKVRMIKNGRVEYKGNEVRK